jgi:hypothetical protein
MNYIYRYLRLAAFALVAGFLSVLVLSTVGTTGAGGSAAGGGAGGWV